jgi:hypothetical protein
MKRREVEEYVPFEAGCIEDSPDTRIAEIGKEVCVCVAGVDGKDGDTVHMIEGDLFEWQAGKCRVSQ